MCLTICHSRLATPTVDTPTLAELAGQVAMNLATKNSRAKSAAAAASSAMKPPETQSVRMSPLIGIAPLGPQPLSKEHIYHQAMLEAAFHHLPHPSDSDRLRFLPPPHPPIVYAPLMGHYNSI